MKFYRRVCGGKINKQLKFGGDLDLFGLVNEPNMLKSYRVGKYLTLLLSL